jgi:replicative DNA helicase
MKIRDRIILMSLLNLATEVIKNGNMTKEELKEIFTQEDRELYDKYNETNIIEDAKLVKEIKNTLKLYIKKLRKVEMFE